MAVVLFIDLSCPFPYSPTTLENRPMGGTEATVVRIAERLAACGARVVVAQHNRDVLASETHGAHYISVDQLDLKNSAYTHVIALRTPKIIPFIRNTWPDAKPYLWLHDFNSRELVEDYGAIEGSGVKIIGVSRTHASVIKDALLTQIGHTKDITISHIYNPVGDELKPGATTRQKGLVFFSSPHKGLSHTLDVFSQLQSIDPEYVLAIANPGYIDSPETNQSGVINLGQLNHAEMMGLLSTAFAVFHLNTVYPETFGLVNAEANALGVPVITHSIGAAPEVLSPAKEQLVDCRNPEAVIKKLQEWQMHGRPVVQCKPEFRMSSVIQKWKEIIS